MSGTWTNMHRRTLECTPVDARAGFYGTEKRCVPVCTHDYTPGVVPQVERKNG